MISLDCASCNKATGDGSNVALVENSLFHDACLKCGDCGVVLQDICYMEFVQRAMEELNQDGGFTVTPPRASVYCMACTLVRNANTEKCDGCNHGFSFNELTVRGIGSRWHECCFRCMNPACKAKLTREYVTDQSKKHFCSMRCQGGGPQYSPPKMLLESPSSSSVDLFSGQKTPPSLDVPPHLFLNQPIAQPLDQQSNHSAEYPMGYPTDQQTGQCADDLTDQRAINQAMYHDLFSQTPDAPCQQSDQLKHTVDTPPDLPNGQQVDQSTGVPSDQSQSTDQQIGQSPKQPQQTKTDQPKGQSTKQKTDQHIG